MSLQTLTGTWKIYDYFDHAWSLFAISDKLLNKISTDTPDINLILDRMTCNTNSYGFINENTVNDIIEECECDECDECEDASCSSCLETLETAFKGIEGSTNELFSSGRGEEKIK